MRARGVQRGFRGADFFIARALERHAVLRFRRRRRRFRLTQLLRRRARRQFRQHRFRARQLRLRRRQRGPRLGIVQPRQHIPLLHLLPFFHQHRHHPAANARPGRHRFALDLSGHADHAIRPAIAARENETRQQ